MAVIAELSGITGRQKAAILMLALGKEQSTKLLGMMHEDELKEVSTAMSLLGTVRAGVVEEICTEFTNAIGNQGNLTGSFEATEQLLLQALPKARAVEIMEEIRGPAGRTMWD